MKELKFRAIDEDGDWMFWDMADAFKDCVSYMARRKEGTDVQQFTGLKDKNGVDIYEGDIIQDDDSEIHKVEFLSGCFIINPGYDEEIGLYSAEQLGCKVVGNIYKNPELLTNGEK